MSSKVKLPCFIGKVLYFHQALSFRNNVHISPGSIVGKLRLGIFMGTL